MTLPRIAPLLVLAAALGCDGGTSTPEDTAGETDVDDTDTDGTADTDDTDDTDDTGGAALRPNVQEGEPPNAEGQTPAFPEQTRAPQPATPTAFRTEVVASGLQIPWGIAPLPEGRLLITERAGRLRVVEADGTVHSPLAGVPDVRARGQGGLLDVAISPDFATNRSVFLTFSEDRGQGLRAAAVARATLSADRTRLEDLSVIYRQQPAWDTDRHYGSRLVFDTDGSLFVTFGDRGSAFDAAQDPTNAIGAVIRLEPDGTIPDDNPFADGGEGAPEVWSWGHRNIQSATLGPDGALWTVEHGPQGGDELNRPEAGVNHGWPIITYGEDYGGGLVGEGITAREGPGPAGLLLGSGHRPLRHGHLRRRSLPGVARRSAHRRAAVPGPGAPEPARRPRPHRGVAAHGHPGPERGHRRRRSRARGQGRRGDRARGARGVRDRSVDTTARTVPLTEPVIATDGRSLYRRRRGHGLVELRRRRWHLGAPSGRPGCGHRLRGDRSPQ